MRRKLAALILLPILICGCGNQGENEHVLSLSAGYVFGVSKTLDGHPTGRMLFNDTVYSFPEGVSWPGPLVAGDQLVITFEGEYQVNCYYTYPATCLVEGKVKDCKLYKTDILGIHLDDATIASQADRISREYLLETPYVILDVEGRCIPLNEYDGQDLFLSVDKRATEEHCPACPAGANCGVCATYIAGLYAYSPR